MRDAERAAFLGPEAHVRLIGEAEIVAHGIGRGEKVESAYKIHIDFALQRQAVMAEQRSTEAVAIDEILVLISRHELVVRKPLQGCANLFGISRQIAAGKFGIAEILQTMPSGVFDNPMKQESFGDIVEVVDIDHANDVGLRHEIAADQAEAGLVDASGTKVRSG